VAMQRQARQRLQALLLRNEIRYPKRTVWTEAHRRWIAHIKLAHTPQQIAFEEYVQAVQEQSARLERLTDAIREHLTVAADHADELSLIQIEWRALDRARQAEMIRRRDAYEARWRATLEAGIADGSLRAFDVRLAGIGILSACNWFTQWYRPGGASSVDEIADAFAELFLGGLRA